MTRLNKTELYQAYSKQEVAILPTFPYLWKIISQDFNRAGLDHTTQRRLKKSVGDLPTVLELILNKPVTVKNIMDARILFIRYAQKDDLVRKLSHSKSLRERINMSKSDVRTNFNTWFVNQAELCTQQQGNDLTHPFIGLTKETQTLLKTGNITIAQLLLIQPTAIYRLPTIY